MAYMLSKLSIALKITNWCNMNCAHCCARSSYDHPLNMMPLSNAESYVQEFKNLHVVPKWDYVCLTGGEPMGPYFYNSKEYIRNILGIIYDSGLKPVIKTNAAWGKNYLLRAQILKDIADMAYRGGKSMLLDFSIDEFHNNLPETANIMTDILDSKYLNPAIMMELVGFKTRASSILLEKLKNLLKDRGIHMESINKDECAAFSGNIGAKIFLDFNSTVIAMGRAIDNVISDKAASGESHPIFGNCLQIDEENIATLNYKYMATVKNGDLQPVVMNLLKHLLCRN